MRQLQLQALSFLFTAWLGYFYADIGLRLCQQIDLLVNMALSFTDSLFHVHVCVYVCMCMCVCVYVCYGLSNYFYFC